MTYENFFFYLQGLIDAINDEDELALRLKKSMNKVDKTYKVSAHKKVQNSDSVSNNGYTNEELVNRIEAAKNNPFIHYVRNKEELPEIPTCLLDDYGLSKRGEE